jgi:hypothetical protein
MCFGSSTVRIPAAMTESELEITVNEVANVVPLIHVIRAYREA